MRNICELFLCRNFLILAFGIMYVIFIPELHVPLVSGEIFTAQVEIENLYKLQTDVVDSIEKYLNSEQLRLKLIRMSLNRLTNKKFSNSPKSKRLSVLNEKSGVNPISAFVLVKFLTTDLNNVMLSIEDKSNIAELTGKIGTLKKERLFPTEEDLTGAALALTRLQDTYLLDTSSLSSGFLKDQYCAPQLTAEDCFEIGRQNYYSKNYIRTIEWMDAALGKLNNDSKIPDSSFPHKTEGTFQNLTFPHLVTESEITEYLLWAKEFQSIINIAQNFMANTMGMKFDDLIDSVVLQAEDDINTDADNNNTKSQPQSYSSAKLKYAALCRGDVVNETSDDFKLHCFYNKANPYMLIGPVKEEILHLDPRISKFHQVLHDGEIELIKKLAQPAFETARVLGFGNSENQKSEVRVSKSAWLTDEHEAIAKINKRIELITGLSMSTAEDLQIANYGLGGHYAPHYDFSSANQLGNFMTEEEGNRIATFLFYMSNVDSGGSTVFPSLNIRVVPDKGSAIFWHNLLENGKGDIRTLHAACPVLLGQKWVSNKWIHERGQEFIRPCRKPNS